MQRTHFTAGYTLYNCVCDKINNSSSSGFCWPIVFYFNALLKYESR